MSAEPSETPGVQARAVGARARADVRFSSENSLADASASLSLPVLARLCRERGYLFPLARPLPPFTLAEACTRLPFLVDAYVSSLDAVTPAGALLSTGRAPRAATGPDLVGAVCARPPLATCVRARVRVLDAKTARSSVARVATVTDAIERVRALHDEGRAFAIAAFRARDRAGRERFVVRAVGGPAAFSRRPGAEHAGLPSEPVGRAGFADVEAPSFRFARSILPGDEEVMREALTSGARVVGAPLMGRLALLRAGEPAGATTTTLGDGAAFASALRSSGGIRG